MDRKYTLLSLMVLFLAAHTVRAEEKPDCPEENPDQCEQATASINPVITRTLGGPDQVENRLDIDSNQVTPMFPSNFARGYFDWKERIKKENGVGIGGDYSFAYLKASDSPGEDDAFGGMYRFYGSWETFSEGKGNFRRQGR